MSTIDAIARAIGAIAVVLSVVLGAKLWGPEAKKARAEGRGSEADAARVMSDTAILWMDRWEEELEVWQDYAYTLESSIEEWTEVFRELKRQVEESGSDIVLPPPPPRHRRPKLPPRHPPKGS